MSPLTDDRIGKLLRVSLAEHEHLADAARAQAIATEALRSEGRTDRRPSRRRLLGAAAVVALLAGGGAWWAGERSGSNAPTPGASGVPGVSEAGNRALAEAEIRRILDLAPVPASATRVADPPEQALVDLGFPWESQRIASTSRYWTAPGSAKAVAGELEARRLTGLMLGWTAHSGQFNETPTAYEVTWSSPDRLPAYEMPTLRLTVVPHGGGVAVRADSFAVWLQARPPEGRVDDPVSSIDIMVTTTPAGSTATSVSSRTLTDPAAVARVVDAFEALAPTEPRAWHCNNITEIRDTRLTFHGAGGDLVADVQTQCPWTITVRRDGRQVGPLLRGGDTLDRLVVSLGGAVAATR